MANALTFARILMVAPFVAAFIANAPWNMSAALAVFVLAMATDFLDGRIARARGETSALGAALDPIADKLMVTAALVLLMKNGVVRGPDAILVVAILARETLVSGLREATARVGAAIGVSTAGKVKTAVQALACCLLIAAAPTGLLGAEAMGAARAALWVAGALTLWSGARYAVEAARVLRQGDRTAGRGVRG